MAKGSPVERKVPSEEWSPPAEWLRIETIDAHAAGEPLRVIVKGFPGLGGKTILERRREAKATCDTLRTALLWEPRGHADMYGCLLTPAVTPGADFGVLFLHNEGWSTMCGHGIIAVTTVALEAGLLPRSGNDDEEVRIDTPAGLVTARARVEQGRVKSVAFRNVPSFVLSLDDRQVGVLHGLDLFAVPAGQAGLTWCERMCAVQGLSEVQGQGTASHSGRSAKKIGMTC